MVMNYLTAILAMAIIAALWLFVQRQWQRHFPEQASAEGDALANRSGCHGCTCGVDECHKTQINQSDGEVS